MAEAARRRPLIGAAARRPSAAMRCDSIRLEAGAGAARAAPAGPVGKGARSAGRRPCPHARARPPRGAVRRRRRRPRASRSPPGPLADPPPGNSDPP
ncbi:hypothetical protein DIJ63_33500, partial [Burkholderia pseudomallei]